MSLAELRECQTNMDHDEAYVKAFSGIVDDALTYVNDEKEIKFMDAVKLVNEVGDDFFVGPYSYYQKEVLENISDDNYQRAYKAYAIISNHFAKLNDRCKKFYGVRFDHHTLMTWLIKNDFIDLDIPVEAIV